MKNLLLVFCIVAVACAISCTESEDITCINGTIAVGLTGFIKTELDSAIVIRYKPDNAFDSIVDTARTVRNFTKDTAYLVPQSVATNSAINGPAYFDKEHDYKIYLPKLARTITISQITLEGNTHQHITHRRGDLLDYGCTNHVKSYTINGIPQQVPANSNPIDGIMDVYVGK